MGKLVVGGEVYYSLSSTALFEVEYESLVLSQAELLFPELVAVPFKKRVDAETGRAAPDLALIEKRYRKWWVVEVELAHHPLAGHVLPQVAVLANANYGADIAEYLSSKAASLDLGLLRDMMKGSQPEVLVIVNEWTPTWKEPLSAFGALLAVVEVFRSDRNRHILRLNGAVPAVPAEVISTLRFDAYIPRLMLVDSPAALDFPSDKKLLLDFEDDVTEWIRIDSSDKVWLSPLKSNPLPPGRRYALVRPDEGRLGIRSTS